MSQNHRSGTLLSVSHTKAFTLIELLVVISIIGLLSSVVLASLNTARNKSRIAAAQSYAASQYRAFGADAVLSFNFNEAGNTDNPVDEVGGLVCVRTGNSTRNDNTPFGIGKSWQLSGTGQYCTVSMAGNTTHTALTSAMNRNKSYTVSLWFMPTGTKSTTAYLLPRTSFFAGLMINANDNRPLARVIYASTITSQNLQSAKSLTVDQWHHLAMSVDTATGSGKMALYVDGQEIASAALAQDVHEYATSNGYHIGGIVWNGTDYTPNGRIDDARVYAQAFTLAEVQKLYAEGLETRKLAQANNQ